MVRGEAPSPVPACLRSTPTFRGGRSSRRGAGHQTVVERNAAGAVPAGGCGLPRGGGPARPLSRWLPHRASRGAWRRSWAQPGADRLRQRLRRAVPRPGAGLSRAGRRGDLHRARLPGVPHRDPGGGRRAGDCARAQSDRRRERDPCTRHAAHARRFHREPEQPDRHLSQSPRGAPAAERAAGQRAARARWRPMPNM